MKNHLPLRHPQLLFQTPNRRPVVQQSQQRMCYQTQEPTKKLEELNTAAYHIIWLVLRGFPTFMIPTELNKYQWPTR